MEAKKTIKKSNATAIEMRNITKTFLGGKIIANNQINFKADYGTVVGLVGENGAGKSTLMSILFGLYQPDNGTILVNGKEQKINSPLIASKLGIGMVPQHFKLVDNMTVLDNIILGVERTKFGVLDRKTVRNEILEISKKYHLEINPDEKVEKLSIGLKQRVEIIKSLFKKSNVIVLDEPTSVLTPQEAEQLIEIIKSFKKDGKLVVFISHKLNEIIEASDQIIVMRKGQITGDILSKNATPNKLSKMMVGETVVMEFDKVKLDSKQPALEIRNLAYKSHGVEKVKQFSLDVYKGEVFGLVGIEGNGQAEVAKMIGGMIKPTHGEILFEGENIANQKLSKRYLNGFGHIPEERQRDGVSLDISVSENMVLNRINEFSHFGIINFRKRNKFTNNIIKKYDVRGADKGKAIFRGLSGGNQQKAVTGREIERANKLLIAAHPTRGVDIGAIKNIYEHIIDNSRKTGATTILLSSELDEIIATTNRIAVFSHGELMGVVETNKVSREQIGLMMTGSKLEKTIKAKKAERSK